MLPPSSQLSCMLTCITVLVNAVVVLTCIFVVLLVWRACWRKLILIFFGGPFTYSGNVCSLVSALPLFACFACMLFRYFLLAGASLLFRFCFPLLCFWFLFCFFAYPCFCSLLSVSFQLPCFCALLRACCFASLLLFCLLTSDSCIASLLLALCASLHVLCNLQARSLCLCLLLSYPMQVFTV